jgi:hypothetical protein
MKYPASIPIIPILLLIALSGSAQDHSALSALSPVMINLAAPHDSTASPGPFRHFEVIDERPDTARIGIHTFNPTFFGYPHDRQLVFKRSAAAEIAAWLNQHFARPDAPYTAFIILRSLWLSDANYRREEMMKDPGKLYQRTHIRLKIEVYAVRDSQYMPVFRFDTLQSYKRSNTYTSLESYYTTWGRDLAALLNKMVDSASLLTASKEGHGRLISLGDILQFNRSRFDAPITGNTSLTPGVYANFDEFRNNAPSIRNYEIRVEKKDRLLYIREPGGAALYSHGAWGYCDGKEIFVMRDGVLCRTWKEGKAFYFNGYADKQQVVPLGCIAIDMDAGKVY